MINDNFIIKYFKYNNFIKYSKLKKCNEDIINYLQNRYEYIDKIEEAIYRIINHIDIRPVCPICGNKLIFTNRNIYSHVCSKKCTNILRQNNIKNTLIEKYGVDNCQKIKSIKEKTKQTCINKYGVNNPAKSEQIKEKTYKTNINKYGTKSPLQNSQIKEKSKQTCLEKYGVEYSFQSENNKEKSKQTCLEKYGKEYYCQSNEFKEKSKQTCLEKYGVEYSFQSKNNKEKSKQTCLEKYGDENYRNIDKFHQTCLKKYGTIHWKQSKYGRQIGSKIMSDPKIQQKRNNTLKQNNTNKFSLIEQKLIKYLNDNNIKYEYQYFSKKYPFKCDFYLIDYNLYLEIQGTWTHGGHPYNKNSLEDQNKLNEWILKNTNYYQNAIYTWTNLDIRKRNIAKENNINLIEIFSNNFEKCKNIINNLIEK